MMRDSRESSINSLFYVKKDDHWELLSLLNYCATS
jgi:hypothetical protein